jgi:aminomethyltransferase
VLQTPLYDEHVSLGGKIVDFNGWALPVQFAGIVQEHKHTRSKVSLFDCSHMAEFRVRGTDAAQAYSDLICSDPANLRIGRSKYGALLNESGGIIDDLISMKLADDDLLIVTNAGPREAVANILNSIGNGIEDVTDSTAKIDIQGPLARDILAQELPIVASLKYFEIRPTEWNGEAIFVSRTGYTGEMGFELFVPNSLAVPLWRALLAHDEVEPAALGARDTLRTEVGYLLSGQDFQETRTPLQARMERFIAWDTTFIGKEALARQRDEGGYPRLAAIASPDRRAPRHDFELRRDGTPVGVVTSGTFGPSVGHGIGLAYLEEDCLTPGTKLEAGPRGLEVNVVDLPFYSDGTCRN